MGLGDLVLGICCVALSTFVFYYSKFFPKFLSGDRELPGPSFFPRLLSFFILAFGIYFIGYGIYQLLRVNDKKGVFGGIKVKWGVLLSYLAVLSTGFIVQPVLNLLGTILGFTAIGFFLMRVFKVKWIQSLVYSLALALVINWIFRGIFKLPLPDGKIFLLLRG